MKIIWAGFRLVVNFFKSAFLSGLATAKIILLSQNNMKSGLAKMSYGELSENTASLLGAMITLTPGTTLVDIDTKSGLLVLHLLDLRDKDEIFQTIHQDFCEHLKIINEVTK